MGSSGTGRLSDYSGKKKQNDGGGGSGGEEDRCGKAFHASLEEVERCDYFRAQAGPPTQGTVVTVTFDKRPAIVSESGELIGYLPTSFNYLRNCLKRGYAYAGLVSSSRTRPIVSVSVDIAPVG
jgi:hypothetical protein